MDFISDLSSIPISWLIYIRFITEQQDPVETERESSMKGNGEETCF